MVVLRESAHAKRSPDQHSTQWPPKSPFQALLSSPSGRKRWEDRQNFPDRRTPSPSPVRHTSQSSQALRQPSDSSEDEDEDTLKLKLQRIETKLKLKELQKSRDRGNANQSTGTGSLGRVGRERESSAYKTSGPGGQSTLASHKDVEIPVSPTREKRAPPEPISPARARLGLTSVARAEDVSLKRARDGTQIKRSNSLRSALQGFGNGVRSHPKSFNERLADSRTTADERQAKTDRLDRIRSAGFGHLTRNSSSDRNSVSTSATSFREGAPGYSTNGTRSLGKGLQRSDIHGSRPLKAAPGVSSVQPNSNGQSENIPPDSTSSSRLHKSAVADEGKEGSPGYDPFTEIHLSKRHISHSVVAREMAGKQVYPLPRLLKEIKSPDYDPPDCESDYVVFAVLASKSEPLDHAKSHRTTDKHQGDALDVPRNKFMVLRLCDLKWEIDCYLFGTAFNQFWKLTPGTLLAILNPAILPPKGNQNNGQFSLKLGSSEDCVMEIGIARDLGYCSSIKKDGQQCGEWIDKSKTEACDFHISLLVDKQRKHRMEVNTMWRGLGNLEPKEASRKGRGTGSSTKRNAGVYHPEYGQLYSVNTGMYQSAATLLDAEDTDALHNMTQAEASRKRIAAAQKDRDLTKQLAALGNSMGAEYLRASHTTVIGTSTARQDLATDVKTVLFSKPSAAELGLLSNKASDAHLSPAKDRKRHFGLGALSMTTGGTAAMGWGGARKAGLLQPRDSRLGSPEKGQTRLETEASRTKTSRPRSRQSSIRSTDSASPQKKRARFALARGIREPGRESLPGEGLGMTVAVADHDGNNDGDDDDELDIV